MQIRFITPDVIDGEMSHKMLFDKMSALARRKIQQRVFEVYTHYCKYLDIPFELAVLVRAQFTYTGIELQSTPARRVYKWVTISPIETSIAIADYIRVTLELNKFSKLRNFLRMDTVGLVVEDKTHRSHTLRDQVDYARRETCKQIELWKYTSQTTAKDVLAKGMMELDKEYTQRKEYGELDNAEICRRKLDILCEVDPRREQATVWENHVTKASYGIV